VNGLPKTVTSQRRGGDLNPDPSAPESSTLTTRLPSHPCCTVMIMIKPHCSRCKDLSIIFASWRHCAPFGPTYNSSLFLLLAALSYGERVRRVLYFEG